MAIIGFVVCVLICFLLLVATILSLFLGGMFGTSNRDYLIPLILLCTCVYLTIKFSPFSVVVN